MLVIRGSRVSAMYHRDSGTPVDDLEFPSEKIVYIVDFPLRPTSLPRFGTLLTDRFSEEEPSRVSFSSLILH